MGYPEHPETVILRNNFYPQGLREIDVWEYYQRVKTHILRETFSRDLMFMVMVEENKPIIVRKGRTTNFIRLNPSNYDDMIHGRVISIYSTMRRAEDLAIIDIDSDDFRKAQIAALKVYEFAMRDIPIVRTVKILFTGKTSFHVVCTLARKINIDSTRFLLRKFLAESELNNEFTIEHKRIRGVPNLDLSPNKFRGAFITNHSLSMIGLKCMEVDHGRVMAFNPKNAIIRRSK